jgi:hypothetical protein
MAFKGIETGIVILFDHGGEEKAIIMRYEMIRLYA